MGANVKLCCSLKWLFQILSESSSFQHLEARKPQKANFRSILLEPYDDHQCLKKELVDLLTDANLYMSTYHVIFPGEKVENESSFERLIHNLAKRGGYVLEDDDVVVNCSMLAQKQPFGEKSHLALLDVLMVQYASNIVTVQRIVKAARRISTFNASKELPNKAEVDLLLVIWLRKVSETVNEEHYYLCPRRKKRTKSRGIPSIAGDLCSGISDGQNLVSLLLYYAPQSYNWSGFYLGNDPLSEKQALNNIQAVCDYCTAHFSPSTFHIPPIDFLQWAESGLLKSNILALLAYLFYSFEVERVMSTLKGYGSSSSSNLLSGTHQFSVLQSANNGPIMNRRTLADEIKQSELPRQLNHSQSTDTAIVLPKLNVSEVRTSKTTTMNRKKSVVGDKLSAEPHMDSASFDSPLRSYFGSQQLSTLAAFRRISQTKDTHSQSSPLLNRPISSTTNQSSQNKPISFSLDNLKLEEQMNAIQRMGSFVRKQKLEHSVVMMGNTAKGSATSRTCEHATKKSLNEFDSSKSGSVSLPFEDSSLKISQSIEEELTNTQPFMSKSFTVHKKHTYATASAAGLPIVETSVKSDTLAYYLNDKSAPRYDKITATTSSADEGDKVSKKTPSELRLAGSSCNVINLTKLLERHLHHDSASWNYNTHARRDTIPPNVRELRVKLISVIDSLQSENLHLESEVKKQILKLHGKKKKTSEESLMVGNIAASTAFSFSKTTFGGGVGDSDPLAIVSIPGINHPMKNERQTGVGFQKVTASLEQFEKDELIVQQDYLCDVGTEEDEELIHKQATACTVGTEKAEELVYKQASAVGTEKAEELVHKQASAVGTEKNEKLVHKQATACGVGTEKAEELVHKQASAVGTEKNEKLVHKQATACGVGTEKAEEFILQQASPCAVRTEKDDKHIHQQTPPCAVGTEKNEELVLQQVSSCAVGTKKDEEPILQQTSPCDIATKGSAGETVAYINQKSIALSPSNSTNSIKTHKKDQMSAAQPSNLERNLSIEASHLKLPTLYSLTQSSVNESDTGHSGNDRVDFEGATASTNPTNPWVPPLHSTPHMENLRKKEQKFRQRLEDRDRARKLASKRWKTGKWVDGAQDNKPERDHYSMLPISAQLHCDEQYQGFRESQAFEALLFTSHMYSGPDCYIKPKSKSNLKIIKNAICTVCLAGEVDTTLKLKTLAKLEKASASHVLILFRDTIGFKFRGIYSYYSGERHVRKTVLEQPITLILRISGSGPNKINEIMISSLYKYNSGQKGFKEIPSKTLSYSVDGLTIKSEFWRMAKHKSLRKITT